ncbi:MAG TPA: hypothetical protein VND94_09680 [Terriglobia bacterium]|nr:hypothetical protein [Terriglobia bacterium]
MRHLVALGGLSAVLDKEPVKQVRVKYSMEDQVILYQLMTEFAAKQPRVIIAALECASRCRLEPIQESARPKSSRLR